MKAKPLIHTNLHLINPVKRKALIARSVITSCAVEGIQVNLTSPIIEIPKRKPKKIYDYKSID